MKNRIILAIVLIALTFGVNAFALTQSEREVVTQMKDTITELRGKLNEAELANDSALASLTLAAIQTMDLTSLAKTAQARAAEMTAQRDMLQDENMVQAAKITALNAKYQRAQFIIAIVSAMAALLLVFQFTSRLQTPYNFLVPVAVAVGVFGFMYALL